MIVKLTADLFQEDNFDSPDECPIATVIKRDLDNKNLRAGYSVINDYSKDGYYTNTPEQLFSFVHYGYGQFLGDKEAAADVNYDPAVVIREIVLRPIKH